jgi:hypothetical protein
MIESAGGNGAGRPGGARPRPGRGASRRRSWTTGTPARLAASLLLVAGAAAAGRVSATRGPLAAPPSAGTGGATAAGADRFASAEEARDALARARAEYARAAAFLAAADPLGAGEDAMLAASDPSPDDAGGRAGADPDELRARVATLDALLPRVRAAARQSPEDAAVNQLYLSAYDARETALRQLGRTLPAGVELTGY